MATTLSQSEIGDFPSPARLMTLAVHAGGVFANQEKALDWLQAPNPSLEGKTPLEAAQTEQGYQAVEDILVRAVGDILVRITTAFSADACVSALPSTVPPFDGEGASRAGDRCNSKGSRVIYTSENRSLAVLEILGHLSDVPPDKYVLAAAGVPEELSIAGRHQACPCHRD